MLKILQYTFLMLLFSSCGEDASLSNKDNEQEEPMETLLLLKERFKGGVVQLSYSYNIDSTLSRIISHDGVGEPRLQTSYTYIGNNITSETILIESGEITTSKKYFTQNDTESLIQFFNSDGELSTSASYLFDGNSCGFTDISPFDALGNSLSNTRVEVLDEYCSSKFYSKYQDDDEYLQWEYTRNDKYDSANSITLPFFRIERQNCVIKLVRKTSDGTVSTNLSYDAVFEYNENNYPVQETRTYLDGDIIEYAYTYYN